MRKFIYCFVLTIIVIFFPASNLYANEINTIEIEAENEEYQIHDAFGNKAHTFISGQSCINANAICSGSISKDPNGNVTNYDISTSVSLLYYENCADPSCSIRVNSITNRGNYISINYTISVFSTSAFFNSQNGTINLY